jgi:hypothetical protein
MIHKQKVQSDWMARKLQAIRATWFPLVPFLDLKKTYPHVWRKRSQVLLHAGDFTNQGEVSQASGRLKSWKQQEQVFQSTWKKIAVESEDLGIVAWYWTNYIQSTKANIADGFRVNFQRTQRTQLRMGYTTLLGHRKNRHISLAKTSLVHHIHP